MLTNYELVEVEIGEDEINPSRTAYDFEVEEDHSYTVAGGICVHNSSCSTKIKTGVGIPTFEVIRMAKEVIEHNSDLQHIKLIADGGLKSPGDCAKMFGVGASGVMLGGYFSALKECPNPIRDKNGNITHFKYFGMASTEAKKGHFQKVRNVEGASFTVPAKNKTVADVCNEMVDGLQSSISMQGFVNLKAFIGNALFYEVSSAGTTLSAPHASGVRTDEDRH